MWDIFLTQPFDNAYYIFVLIGNNSSCDNWSPMMINLFCVSLHHPLDNSPVAVGNSDIYKDRMRAQLSPFQVRHNGVQPQQLRRNMRSSSIVSEETSHLSDVVGKEGRLRSRNLVCQNLALKLIAS